MSSFTAVERNYLELTERITALLGRRPTESELEAFPYSAYRFIFKSIRDADKDETIGGTRLLERWFQGIQEIWVRINQRIDDLEDTLFDPNLIEIEYLRGLSKLLGWGDDLIDVWTVASDDEKRKLVIGAIAFWQLRWLESGIELAIRLTTGNRFKARNYFDFRWVLGENIIMEEMQNSDCHLLSLDTIQQFQQGVDGETQKGANPRAFSAASGDFSVEDEDGYIVIQHLDSDNNGIYPIDAVIDTGSLLVTKDFPSADTGLTWFLAFKYDEYITEIRLVDDLEGQGAVNRDLLEKLLELQRPSSERFNVLYMTFMDLFTTDYDLGQWDISDADILGMLVPTVHDGVLDLTGHTGHLPVDYYNDENWQDFTFTTSASLETDGALDIMFCYQDEDNHYKLHVEREGFGTGVAQLWKNIDGVQSQIGSDYAFPELALNTYWNYRIHQHGPALDPDLLILGQYNDFTGQTFVLDYLRDGDSPTITTLGSPSIVAPGVSGFGAGAVLLSGAEGVKYTGTNLQNLINTGCIRFRVKPGYSGTPTDYQKFFLSLNTAQLFYNSISITHMATTGTLTFSIRDATGNIIISNSSYTWNPTSGTWYEIEMNFDVTPGTGFGATLRVDGDLKASATGTGTRDNLTNQYSVGELSPGSDVQNYTLDELQVFDEVKHTANYTPAIIEQSMTNTLRVEIDGDLVFDEEDSVFLKGKIGYGLWSPLIVHAKYNDVSGQDMDLDYVRDGNAGTASVTGDPDIITETQIGEGALELAGVSHERIDYTGAGLVDAMVQKWTMELFIRPKYSGSPSAVQYICTVCDSSGSNNNGIMIYHDLAGDLYGQIMNSSGASQVLISAAWSPTANDLYHIALVSDADGGQHRMFLDGDQHGSTDYSTFTRTANAQLLRIGSNTIASTLVNDFVVPELVLWSVAKWKADFTERTEELTTQEDLTVYVTESELWRYPTTMVRVGPNP